MNIAVLSHRVPFPPIKGEKIRTYHQLESLRAAGCDITLFCPLHDPEDSQLTEAYSTETGIEVFTAPAGRGWLRMAVAGLTGKSLSVGKFHVQALQSKLDSYLAANEVDVLFCTSSAMAEYAFVAARTHPEKRIIVDFMDVDSDKWSRFSAMAGLPMSLVYQFEAYTLGRYEQRIQSTVERCLFVSQAEVDLLEKRWNTDAGNLQVIGNGVDLSDYYPPVETGCKEPLTLLFTGVMDYLPNEDAICWFVDNVWEKLVHKFPHVRLVVAGMKPTQRVLDLQNRGNIQVTGFVEEMLPYYHEADIFIAPFQIARGVQNKILQAFACGLPVVTTPIGAEGVDGADDEHFLVAQSPEQFVDKIERLVGQSDVFDRISTAARQLITDQYLWEAKNRPLIDLVFSNASE